MDRNMQPQERSLKPEQIPLATDVFYANGVNIDINPTELILTFDQHTPTSEPQVKSIILNANAIYQLRNAFINLVEVHEKNLDEMAKDEQKRN